MIIGLAGSFGAGKGTVVEYLTQKGFTHYSASEFIKEEIVRRGMSMNRESMITVGNDLRARGGPAHIITALYERAQQSGKDVVIESLRAPAEVREIKRLGGFVIGVDAEQMLRYTRSQARNSEKDGVSFEKFVEQEQLESNTDDPTKQNIFGALKESDVIVQNNGTLEELHAQVDAALEQITK